MSQVAPDSAVQQRREPTDIAGPDPTLLQHTTDVAQPSPKRHKKGVVRAGLPPLRQPGSQSTQDTLHLEQGFVLQGIDVPEAIEAKLDEEHTSATLAEEELVLRRLTRIEQLIKLYKSEYWVLAEELRTRHFVHYEQHKEWGWRHSPSIHLDLNEQQLATRDLVRRKVRRRAAGGRGAPWQAADMHNAMTTLQNGGATALLANGTDTRADAQMRQNASASAHSKRTAADMDVDLPTPGNSFRAAEAFEHDSDEDPATFTDIEDIILSLDPPSATVSKDTLLQRRQSFCSQLGRIGRLEQAASASAARELDRQGALAALCGRTSRYLIKRSAVTLGRNTVTGGKVDVDLQGEGDAQKVSRRQAQISLHGDGKVYLRNTARRSIHINDVQVDQDQVHVLEHLSLVEVGGIRLLFMVNQLAMRRALNRSANFTI